MIRLELPFPVPLSACSIEGCGRPVASKGWCWAHYNRWRKTGDPGAERPVRSRAANGEPDRYFREVVLPYDGDECLTWPFTKTGGGYGLHWLGGRFRLVSRLVCEEKNGPPPTPEHEAAHSCGKGHEACCTKRHLSWKTGRDNKKDKAAHGTQTRGESHPVAKLTLAEVNEIRRLRGTVSQAKLAETYGVSSSQISRIQRGLRW